ncbi:MAG: helix-turn-helix domain-containing protein [Waddliaceae bacterium]
MSEKELERQAILLEIEHGNLTMTEGADRLGLSLRQLRRSRRQYENHGLAGLTHRGRGRSSGRALRQEDLIVIKRLLYHL